MTVKVSVYGVFAASTGLLHGTLQLHLQTHGHSVRAFSRIFKIPCLAEENSALGQQNAH